MQASNNRMVLGLAVLAIVISVGSSLYIIETFRNSEHVTFSDMEKRFLDVPSISEFNDLRNENNGLLADSRVEFARMDKIADINAEMAQVEIEVLQNSLELQKETNRLNSAFTDYEVEYLEESQELGSKLVEYSIAERWDEYDAVLLEFDRLDELYYDEFIEYGKQLQAIDDKFLKHYENFINITSSLSEQIISASDGLDSP